jgi:hypothetical protein
MALDSEDPRAFVLAQLKGKGKKRSTAAPTKSSIVNKPTTSKLVAKKRHLQTQKKTKTPTATNAEVSESVGQVKRLRQDALQWKVLSAQPEDFEDNFEDDVSTVKDTEGSKTRKSDAMTNLFDNEGGMMMLEEVEGVDVVWEEDGKGGKKATLIVSTTTLQA